MGWVALNCCLHHRIHEAASKGGRCARATHFYLVPWMLGCGMSQVAMVMDSQAAEADPAQTLHDPVPEQPAM